MSDETLGLGAAVLAFIASAQYNVDILRGGTRPQRITFGVWLLIGLLGLGGTLQGGARWGAAVAIVLVGMTAVTFALSLHPRFGKEGGRHYDVLLGVVSLAALVSWQAMSLSPNVAVTFALAADISVTWLVLRDAWVQPETESLFAWSASSIAALLSVCAVNHVAFATIAYPLYIAVANGLVAAILVSSRRFKPHGASNAPR